MILKKYGQAFFRIGESLSAISTVAEFDSVLGKIKGVDEALQRITFAWEQSVSSGFPVKQDSCEPESSGAGQIQFQTAIKNNVFDEQSTTFLCDNLKIMLTYCEAAELTSSAQGIKRILDLSAELKTSKELKALIDELKNRLRDELTQSHFMHIPNRNVEYYQSGLPFGKEATRKFPKATEDIDEAAKCFAVGRNTVCVFHLMRVMELGVQSLGKKLGISKPTEKEWQAILNDVNGAIKKLSNPPTPITAKQKKARNGYAQAAVYLENVKNAWRNDVMHPKATYTNEEAEEVFRTVKVYMQYLAKIL